MGSTSSNETISSTSSSDKGKDSDDETVLSSKMSNTQITTEKLKAGVHSYLKQNAEKVRLNRTTP